MTTITRHHDFQNKLTLIEQKRKYYYCYYEHNNKPIKLKRNKKLDQAFQNENWRMFEFEILESCRF